MGRTLVVGDIHGCYDELQALVAKVDLDSQDRVVAVGDLTVKGPKSREVLELFSKDERFSSVIGNHDRALVKYWKGDSVFLKTSQQKTFKELLAGGKHLLEYLASLPSYLELDRHIVVHAGVRPGVPLDRQVIDDLVELRTLGADRTNRDGKPWYEEYDGEKTVLFGHWPAPKPRRGKRAIGLDTGCVYGYQLTGYLVEENQFVSVDANASYDTSVSKKAN
jgi:diadenosine tetraphosphatase ApaH/serine/threonine PP2A family protein phosphatase